ncbi:hypothetical protein [Acinetobacter rudis]|uniref:Phage abortive infection protein n=1 Tax=Acinetobacter rudis TaxID=632955 RepID=A0AAW8J3B5_9GAMM|nr:hypothetical protein [Acinetobacter rudis]MDQ8934486.1 hypothetical protein [Acinetobacter rudis]MDQ9016614.1 hypothetical protein [Acinetobacter rudis]
MKIKDITQTVILCGAILFIPLLALSYYLYLSVGLSGVDLIEKSLTAASGFFGGVSTLTAAYVAMILFNDWKDVQRHEIAKQALIALIKLKTHIDNNYFEANYHLDSYFLKEQTPQISNQYVEDRLNSAKNSQQQKEEYKKQLKELLVLLYEKIDIYEAVSGSTLIKEEDRAFNFPSFAYYISNMYTCASNGDLEDIETHQKLAPSTKRKFETTYYNYLLQKLKRKVNLQ